MKLTHPLVMKTAGLLGAKTISAWMRTLDYQGVFYQPEVDPVDPEYRGQKIYIFWHEYILYPIYLRGHCHLAMLLSQHRDAEVLGYAAHHLGFETVRGSTRRGGIVALREMLRKSRQMNLTITPDGPRGPRRKLAQGPIYLASKLQLPLVLLGLGYDRPWRMNSWDRFAVPRPGSRARSVVSPEIHVPHDLDRDGIEAHRRHVEQLLNRLTEEAEHWAESGRRHRLQVPIRREVGHHRLGRLDPPQPPLSRPHFLKSRVPSLASPMKSAGGKLPCR